MCTKRFSWTKNKGKLCLVAKSSGPLLAGLPLKCNCRARPREIRKKWHMLEKFDILIFRPEIPYCESINVVYFLGEKLFVFSRKFSKTATAVKCPKLMPRVRIQKLCSSISQKEVGFFEIYILV